MLTVAHVRLPPDLWFVSWLLAAYRAREDQHRAL